MQVKERVIVDNFANVLLLYILAISLFIVLYCSVTIGFQVHNTFDIYANLIFDLIYVWDKKQFITISGIIENWNHCFVCRDVEAGGW